MTTEALATRESQRVSLDGDRIVDRVSTESEFVGDLSRLLGTAETKATAWLEQRKAILEQLTALRDNATRLIRALSGESGITPLSGKTPSTVGSPAGSHRPGTRRRKRSRPELSVEARARISTAQKERWARLRAESKK